MLRRRSYQRRGTIMNIVNDFVPANIIVKLKLPNQRAYEVAWSIALLRGYENLDEFVNDVFLDSIEMFPDGRDDFDNVNWGFKTKGDLEKEEEKQVKVSR
jgi:hypothetical protein